jgi:hypothetical protein
MSSISGATGAANLAYQLQQVASKHSAKPTTTNPQQPIQTPKSDADHDGDSDGAGGFDKTA